MKPAIALGLTACAATWAAAVDSLAPQPPAVDLATQPTLYVVGYAHLDTQWRWCYPITIREYLADTLHDNFALLEKYPSYVFNFSGSRRYQMMKEYYPTEYDKLREYIAAGRWFPCGSSVDENDANVPSAESLIRQVLYGNRYFRREFGVASEEYMLPDCFGFPAALPSVLAHCGLKGFSTQKLTWGSAVGIPFKVGVWEGPDGSSIVAALDPGAYVGEVRSDLCSNDSWRTRIDNNGKLSGVFADYHYFGTGDMGGAPTEKSVAMVEQSVAGDGPVNVICGPADWMFKAITSEMRDKFPRYKGEMLLTEHSAGSITSQSYMKRWNRKNELLAEAAEKAATAVWWLGAPYPAQRLEDAWTLVLGSQMHDILPGTSHPKAYEYSWNDEVLAANLFASVLTDAVGAVSSIMDTRAKGMPIVVFNPLSIEREDVVEMSIPWAGEAPQGVRVIGPGESIIAAQVLELKDGKLRLAALPRVPSMGFLALDVQAADAPLVANSVLRVSERELENERYRVTLNEDGDVASIFDKQAKRELLSAPARLALLHEKPAQWPAWNMDWKDRQQPPRSFVSGPATFRTVERGPVRVAIEVTREHEGSTYVQTIRLAAGGAGDRVEFDTRIDWMTRERSLKASFPLSVSNPVATYDIQVGTIERDNNNPKRYENPAHQWFDLTDAKGDYGVTIINDSKYGSDKPDDSSLRLTLLYTPGVSGDYQDQGTQDLGRHEVLYAVAGHEGDWRTALTPWIAARVNQPLRAFVVPAHEGRLRRSFSLASVSDPRVMITAVKKAEDADSMVVRLRELTGKEAREVRLTMPMPIAQVDEVDGQERLVGPTNMSEGALVTGIRGYGLRAFAVKPAAVDAALATPQFTPLLLPFNADVISTNSKRDNGRIGRDERTYPAEQLGATIDSGGATFSLGPVAEGELNAVSCIGQSIPLPSGEFDRIELLVASVDGDHRARFSIDGSAQEILVPWWRGFIGQWDNRAWNGPVAEVAFNWPAKFTGLTPGYVKPCEVAWFCTHHHAPGGDQPYEYCYLFKTSFDVSPGAKALTLPNNDKILVLAATLVKDERDEVIPAAPLFDILDDRVQDAPRMSPGKGTFSDATEVRIEPRLYGRSDAVRYTLDGTPPTASSIQYTGPIVMNRPTTVRAAIIGAGDELGPEAQARLEVNDRTPPRIVSAGALFNQPQVQIAFSEAIDPESTGNVSNYSFEPAVVIREAAFDSSARQVVLTLESPLQDNAEYLLRVRGVRDASPAHNQIVEATVTISAPTPVFHLANLLPEQRGRPINGGALLPMKGSDRWTLNLSVRTDEQPPNRTIIAGFGACDAKRAGTGRYLSKFANGIHFWSHNADLEGKTPLELKRWQMLTATYDGRTLRLYEDGALLSAREVSFADDEPVIYLAPPDPWEHKRQFEGEIRELTIWNVALDDAAIRSLKSAVELP
jgi:alpha-mannosidase